MSLQKTVSHSVRTPANLNVCKVLGIFPRFFFEEPIDRVLKHMNRVCVQKAENGRFFGVPKISYLWVLRLFEIFHYGFQDSIHEFLKKRGKKPKTPTIPAPPPPPPRNPNSIYSRMTMTLNPKP